MKPRTFSPSKVYRLVEFRQPYYRSLEPLLNAKIRFKEKTIGHQDTEGFIHWFVSAPRIEILSGREKGMQNWGLPNCRILTVRSRSLVLCSCPAYRFPHRPGSGACPHA